MITFRPMVQEDVEFVNKIRNQVREYLHDDRALTFNESLEWFVTTQPRFYMIVYNECSIGYFRTSEYSKENRRIYIGADLDPKFWGQGHAKRAYRKFIPYLFETLDLNKIGLEVLSTNIRAFKLYQSLGFTQEGTKRQDVHRNGEFADSIIMSILKEEYNASRS
tara:strand:+ start:314 stop:805 length:492 start_codon:yes stop_codon:yes gene_type:complete